MSELIPSCLPNQRCSLFASVFSHTKDAILVVNKDLQIMEANPAAERLSSLPLEKLKRTRLNELCISGEQPLEVLVSGPRDEIFELWLKTGLEQRFPVSVSSSPLPEPDAYVLILRDISDQQKREQERITQYIIQAQEEERKRLARDLHDGIGQALYSVLVGLKVLSQSTNEPAIGNHLTEVHYMAARALEEVKIMAVELRPAALDDLGLVPALRSYLKRFEETFGIETSLGFTGNSRRYCTAVETALYRICQEALTNAAKYADSNKVSVELLSFPDRVQLSVRDFGRGFNPKAKTQSTGLGLYGMRERAALLGGELEIDSGPGKGTLIKANIPLNDKGEPLNVNTGNHCR